MTTRTQGLVIAIDGPSGAGKSTVARLLAERFGYLQIDTGAMYRALAYLVSSSGIDEHDTDALTSLCRNADIRLEQHAGVQKVLANGEDVTAVIRTPHMSLVTSRISTYHPVREALMSAQRKMGQAGGVVLEGRDIGTVVFPDAECKFFLSATAQERAHRRFLELSAKGETVSEEETLQAVIQRDLQDSERDIAPLKQADDACLIDSSTLSIDLVLQQMEQICRSRAAENGVAL